MVEIKVLKKEREKLSFIISGINYAIANTLRRTMIVEVPVIAIKEVEIEKNMSALYDEILAHRFGLVPIKTDLKSYNLPQDCKCGGKGCAMCELKLSLKVAGPCTVKASDIQSKDPKCTPVYSEMPIIILEKNKKLELNATAVLGKGKEHMKFSPGLVYYKAYPKITIKDCSIPEKCQKICPKKVFNVENGKLKVKNLEACDLCEACVDICKEGIKVEPEKDKFIFHIESWGQLSPKEILLKSLEIIDKKATEFAKDFKKAKLE